MNENDMLQYHKWLLKRSLKGYLYRRYYLYPKIWQHVEGSIVDIGCGIGDFVKLTPNAVGVDINRYNVDYCLSKSINAVFFRVHNCHSSLFHLILLFLIMCLSIFMTQKIY